jgi:hypothetical protein
MLRSNMRTGVAAARIPWGPPQGNGWFPKISPDGKWILYGFWQTFLANLETGQEYELTAPTGARLNPVGFLDAQTVIAATETGPAAVYRFDVNARVAQDLGVPPELSVASWVGAGYGHWGLNLATAWVCVKDGQKFRPDIVQYGIALSGDHLVTSNHETLLRHFRGNDIIREIPMDNSWTVNQYGDICTGYYGPLKVYPHNGSYVDGTITPWRREGVACPVRRKGKLWLWNATDDDAARSFVMGRELGDADPIVLENFPAVAVAAVCPNDGDDWVVAGNNDKGQLQVRWCPVTHPRTNLRVTTPAVLPRTTKQGELGYFFQYSGQYGDSPEFPGNVTIIVKNVEADIAALQRALSLGEVVVIPANLLEHVPTERLRQIRALYIGSERGWEHAELEAQEAKRAWGRTSRGHIDVFWYVTPTEVRTPGFKLPPSVDIVGPQIYLDDFNIDLEEARAQIWNFVRMYEAVIPKTLPWWPICQAFDRRKDAAGTVKFRPDTLANMQPEFFEVFRNRDQVKGLIFFAANRPGGVRDYPEVLKWHHAMCEALPSGPPWPKEEPMPQHNPPKITITEYSPRQGTAPLRVRAIYRSEPDAGRIDTLQWMQKRTADREWNVVAPNNDPNDPDHTYTFTEPGEWEIKLRAIGPGGEWETGARRVINVSASQEEPDRPVPDVDEDELLTGDVTWDYRNPLRLTLPQNTVELIYNALDDNASLARNANSVLDAMHEARGPRRVTIPNPARNWFHMVVGTAYALMHEEFPWRKKNDRDLPSHIIAQAVDGWTGDRIREWLRASDEYKEHHAIGKIDPSQPVPVGNRKLQGQMRVVSSGSRVTFGDDTGPRTVNFLHWFPALNIYKYQRDEAQETLNKITSAGWQGVRILTAVGYWDAFWHDREVAPTTFRTRDGREIEGWRDYDQILEQFLRECQARGLKVELSAGDLQGVFPSNDEREGDRHALLTHCDRVANVVNRVGQDVVALYEVCNEAWQNGVPDRRFASELALRFKRHCPNVLTALSDSSMTEEPEGLIEWSQGADVVTLHGTRDRHSAARRAFNVLYEKPEEIRSKPVWQGEPTGPDGGHPLPAVYLPIDDPNILFSIYAVHLMTGQGSVFINGPGLRHWRPIDSTWGFYELPRLFSEIFPEDIGLWPRVLHGNRGDAPITAESFADRGDGPERVDMAFNDSRVVCVVHGGNGSWRVRLRRSLRWKLYSANGLETSGEGNDLPEMDASMGCRVIVGEFI